MIAIFLCFVTAVHDGDTFTCLNQQQRQWKVRLEAIDAPEIGRCPSWKHCTPGDAQASRRALSRMILHRSIDCKRTGRSYQRITAWCTTPAGADVSCAMHRAGFAVQRYDRDQRLCR